MQPGSPGPGQDPYQQYQPGYGQVPPYPDPFGPQSGPPYAPQSGSPYPPDPFEPPAQPVEYSLYADPQPAPPPMPQYGYAVPPMMPPRPMTNQNNTFGLLSMIFGIVALPMICCFYSGAAIGVAAAVLGVVGLNKANRGEADNKGMAIAGLVCGSVAGLIGIVLLIAQVAFNVSEVTYP
jgi:hypothetical protein